MTIESLEKVLRDHPFLKDMAPEHVQLLVSCASNRRFETGEYLAREGEKADILYLLRDGRVAIETRTPQGGGLRIETMEGGDTVGWSCFLEPFRWRFDARAVATVLTLALDASCLRRKLEEDHEFGFQLLKRLTGRIEARLQATRLQLLDVYGKPGETGRRDRR